MINEHHIFVNIAYVFCQILGRYGNRLNEQRNLVVHKIYIDFMNKMCITIHITDLCGLLNQISHKPLLKNWISADLADGFLKAFNTTAIGINELGC